MPHAVVEIFLWLLGLCVGSFLNVVVYRLPAGLSIRRPLRSFCPRCGAQIRWYDNLPLASWWLLGGRCRSCAQPISVQYPLVEGLTGMGFVLVYHLLFVAGCHARLEQPHLSTDFPLLLAWLGLLGGLVACSAMDLVSYAVDVRITNVVLVAAILLHALWPRPDLLVPLAASPAAAATTAAFLASGIILWWTAWRRTAGPELGDEPDRQTEAADRHPTDSRPALLTGRLATAASVALTAWLVYLGRWPAGRPQSGSAVAACLLVVFATIVLVGGQRRPADEEIRVAIERERPTARRTACRELIWLSPAVIAAGAALAALRLPAFGQMWGTLVSWRPVDDLVPLGGLVSGMHGAIVGAIAGWALRIAFTLIFGREAFGIGDIYILTAAGAAGGWDIALLGLLLSIGIALAGWLLGLLLKTTVMIPFGPWLAVGFVLALWWHRPASRIARVYRDNLSCAWHDRPDLLLVAAGLLLLVTGAAVILARLVRRWVAPDAP